MFKSFRIGSLMGIPIKLDVTFLLILPIFAWVIAFQVEELIGLLNLTFGIDIPVEPMTEGSMPWILGSLGAIGLFASVLLHELGHSVAAIRYGFPIKSITLWLLGGVAQLTEQPTNWREELVIAIAGPIVSIALGVGLWVGVYLVPVGMDALLFVVAYLAVMNLILAAFNMLPGFPMDGGRVLRALLARNQSFAVATAQAARVGKVFAIGLGLFGLFFMNFILVAVALFIYIAASGEARHTALKHAMDGIVARDVMTPADHLDVVGPELTVEELIARMYQDRHTGYPVLENGDVVGVVALDDVRGISPEQRSETRVADIMTTDITSVHLDDEAFDAIQALQQNDIGRLLVLDADGNLAGLITRSDLVTALDIGSVRTPASPTDDPGAQLERVPAEGQTRW